MSDFAEGLISAIAGGVQGGANAVGDIYEGERKSKMRLETETQLAQAQADIQEKKRIAEAEFLELQRREGKKADFEQEKVNFPEKLRMASETATKQAEIERSSKYSKEAIAGEGLLAAAKHIEPADRDAEGRKLRNDVAKLQLKNLQEDERIPKSVKDQAASLYKQADSLTTSIVNAELKGEAAPEGLTAVQGKLDAINSKIGDLLKPYRPETEKPRSTIDDLFPVKGKPAASPQAATAQSPAASTQKAPTLPANPTQADIRKFDNYFGENGKAQKLLDARKENARGNK